MLHDSLQRFCMAAMLHGRNNENVLFQKGHLCYDSKKTHCLCMLHNR